MPRPAGRTRHPKLLPSCLETPTLLYLLRADPKAGGPPQDTQLDPKTLATSQGGISPTLPFPSLSSSTLHSCKQETGKKQDQPCPGHAGSTATSHFFPLAMRGAPEHPPALAGHQGLWQQAQEEEATTTTLGQGTVQPVLHAPCAASTMSGPDKLQPSEG